MADLQGSIFMDIQFKAGGISRPMRIVSVWRKLGGIQKDWADVLVKLVY
jgi:hypothetical protein